MIWTPFWVAWKGQQILIWCQLWLRPWLSAGEDRNKAGPGPAFKEDGLVSSCCCTRSAAMLIYSFPCGKHLLINKRSYIFFPHTNGSSCAPCGVYTMHFEETWTETLKQDTVRFLCCCCYCWKWQKTNQNNSKGILFVHINRKYRSQAGLWTCRGIIHVARPPSAPLLRPLSWSFLLQRWREKEDVAA